MNRCTKSKKEENNNEKTDLRYISGRYTHTLCNMASTVELYSYNSHYNTLCSKKYPLFRTSLFVNYLQDFFTYQSDIYINIVSVMTSGLLFCDVYWTLVRLQKNTSINNKQILKL